MVDLGGEVSGFCGSDGEGFRRLNRPGNAPFHSRRLPSFRVRCILSCVCQPGGLVAMANDEEPSTRHSGRVMSDHSLNFAEMAGETLPSVVSRALAYVAEHGLPGDHHFYISFRTNYPGTEIPEHLREHYPNEMTIVVPSNYSIRRGIPTDSECSRIAFADAYDSLSAALHRPPKPSRQGLAAIRTHCPSPSAVGARAQTDDPVPADPHRPVLLGLALSFVAGLPGRRGHRQAGHRHSLAPKGLSVVLDMEVQAATTGTPAGAPRGQGVDPANEP